MSETVYGVHLLVFVSFVSLIADIVKSFFKKFYDSSSKNNNSTNDGEKNIEKNESELNDLDTNGDDEFIDKDEKESSEIQDKGSESENKNSLGFDLPSIDKIVLFILDNMLPHLILGNLYKIFNGFFREQEKYLPPFLWIDFLPQRIDGNNVDSLKRFILFSISRSALGLIYSIIYPLIYGIEYKPMLPKL